jgi:hypothetical protein
MHSKLYKILFLLKQQRVDFQAGAMLMNAVLFGLSEANRLNLPEVAEHIELLTKETLCADSAALYMIEPASKTMISLPHKSNSEWMETFQIAESNAAWTVIRGKPWRSVCLKLLVCFICLAKCGSMHH